MRWIAAALGFFAFALSLVRSTWGGWVIALLIQLVKSNNKVRVRIVASAVLLAGFACRCSRSARWPSGCRRALNTIVNLNDDQSYAARNEFYATFAKTAFTDVSGEGMGATGTSTKLSNDGGQLGQYGNFDSGVMNIPFVLGWPGTLLYMSGIVWLVVRAVLASFKLRDDKFVSACLSLALATFAMLVFTNSLVGTGGLLLFMSLFSILSAVHYEKMNRRRTLILHGGTD